MNADDRRIPWKETESDESELRRNQKISSLPNSAKNELRGLTELTQRQCQLIPNLVDYYQTQQSDEMCVPGGYILFIAMSYCPGRPVGGDKFRGLGVEERVGIRKAFRRAYEYVSFSLLTCWIMADG